MNLPDIKQQKLLLEQKIRLFIQAEVEKFQEHCEILPSSINVGLYRMGRVGLPSHPVIIVSCPIEI